MANKRTVVGAGAALAVVIAFITPKVQQLEGTKHLAYRDTADVLTVCSGHTGPDVRPRKHYTDAECADLTQEDLQKAASGVLKYSPDLEKHPMQLAAAISFSYNVGVGTYSKSSVARDFNAGDFKAGCSDLLKYTYAAGKYSDGLYNRRKAEYNICISDLK